MKSKSIKLISCVFSILIFLSFKSKLQGTSSEFESNLALELKNEIDGLELNSKAFRENKISIDSLQKVYLDCRKAYKKVEFQLAFQFPEYVSSKINGAPLLHIEKENSRPILANPEGLQVLDELIFSEESAENKNEIANLAIRLNNNYKTIYNKVSVAPLNSADAILAIRIQLIRIFTLGITGFDTPGSVNAIDDSCNSLIGIKNYLENNSNIIPEKNRNSILNKIENTIVFLKQSNFENLDRLALVKNHLDPIYAELLPFQKNQTLKVITSWNPNSTSLFDSEFLNPYQFTNLKKEEDSDELRSLGKSLFFDSMLSHDNKMNCATCHQPEKGFADGTPKSISNKNGITVFRNSPTLLNSAYADRYFYDLRAYTLEQQVEHVIFNNLEFNTSYAEILNKLNSNKTYCSKFKNIFKKKTITREDFTKALASYVLSLKSFNSSFDKYVRGESSKIETSVANGFNLFTGKANCATCHFSPTFSGLVPPLYIENESEILGVFSNPTSKELDEDEGRYNNGVLYEKSWIYEKSFKTVTVRNANETAPYFHNGTYATLDDVLEFYNQGGGEGMGISTRNQTLGSDKLNLTTEEKNDIIAFIKSLSDNKHPR
ncbi:cytochrome-c peroxidase [Flavobacterium sp. F372]|uniref:Cytochrome-c peroxidase n=1 Tax=Flavobacterium bernardetii TaxID=2813823 RepID=A0ABR7IY64_9FLAO|nr:cytochrome c peroxidase [Flavobacterium bernardetii]MBC5834720.1 cytochrome-c peroxidase [Flavobacterium bernardetii]NHF70368.1 cytochrome-c peroxidase [Flavobacterium bernardetii]